MRKTILLLLLFLVLAMLTYIVNSDVVKVLLVFVISIIALRSKHINEFLVFCGLSLIFSSFSSSALWMIACFPLFLNKSVLQGVRIYLKYIIPFLLLAFMSFLFGYECELTTMIVLFMAVLLFVQETNKVISSQELWLYSVFSLSILIFVLLYVGATEGFVLKFGRLSVDGSIRTVANAAAFPAFVSWSLLLQKEESINKFVLVLTGIISSTILLLTVSKGAIIAVVVSVLVCGIFSVSRKSVFYLVLIVGILYFFFSKYVLTLGDYRFDRLTEEYNGFSGRTDIWQTYLYHFTSSIETILFGFGPGDTKRFSFADEMYAHSLYLDLLLSYGILMTLLFLFVLIKIAIKIIKNKNAISISLFMFTFILYVTHGVITAFPFYVYMGVAFAICNSSVIKKDNFNDLQINS